MSTYCGIIIVPGRSMFVDSVESPCPTNVLQKDKLSCIGLQQTKYERNPVPTNQQNVYNLRTFALMNKNSQYLISHTFDFLKKRIMNLIGHKSIKDSPMTSFQKESYLHINRLSYN